jgi:hypothetical protein
MSTFRALTREEVTFSIAIEPEDLPIIGNAMASGDDDLDIACEKDIIRRLDSGNPWAWCCIRVTASWEGFSANEYLGACSYQDEEDFKSDGYYDSMCQEALTALNAELLSVYQKLSSRVET